MFEMFGNFISDTFGNIFWMLLAALVLYKTARAFQHARGFFAMVVLLHFLWLAFAFTAIKSLYNIATFQNNEQKSTQQTEVKAPSYQIPSNGATGTVAPSSNPYAKKSKE